MAAKVGRITVNVDVNIQGRRVLIFDADTGERLNPSEGATGQVGVVIGASMLPGVHSGELDRWYGEHMLHDDPSKLGRLEWVPLTDAAESAKAIEAVQRLAQAVIDFTDPGDTGPAEEIRADMELVERVLRR